MLRFFLPFLAFVMTTLTAGADALVLANKDRITGTLVREENGWIVFQSDLLGEVSVPSDRARIEFSSAKKEPRRPSVDYKFKPLDLRTAAKDPKQVAKADQIGWVRRLEFGFTSQSGGSKKSDMALNFEAGRRGKRSEARFLARYLFGESNDQQTSDLLESSLRLRRNLSENTFAQSSTRVSRDTIKQIDLDAEQGIGLGRNVLNTDSLILAFGAGAAARYRDETVEPGGWAYLVDGFQDMRYEINSRLSIVQDLSMVVAPTNSDDYKIRLNAALTGKVTESFNMSMRYEYEYDRSLALDLRDNQRIVTALVYVF
jgi:putative salt-induced outer membrane protein YdiY